jgi:hypothetical protein
MYFNGGLRLKMIKINVMLCLIGVVIVILLMLRCTVFPGKCVMQSKY